MDERTLCPVSKGDTDAFEGFQATFSGVPTIVR
jgi:hypothetical protein